MTVPFMVMLSESETSQKRFFAVAQNDGEKALGATKRKKPPFLTEAFGLIRLFDDVFAQDFLGNIFVRTLPTDTTF